MSRWTHSICSECYEKLYPGRTNPVRFKEEFREEEPCCFCQKVHKSGIYVRHDPKELRCTHD